MGHSSKSYQTLEDNANKRSFRMQLISYFASTVGTKVWKQGLENSKKKQVHHEWNMLT